MKTKTMKNTTSDGATKNVRDIKFWGNGDTFKLISKAWSEEEGWMKSTKAMEISGVGCVVQVTTQQLNDTGVFSYKERTQQQIANNIYPVVDFDDTLKNSAIAEAVTFVPGAKIKEDVDADGNVVGRKLVSIAEPS